MPILRLLENQGFDPEAVKVLVAAFERARDRLDPSDRLNPLVVELVAMLTIDFAKQGEGIPDRLCEVVLEAVAPERFPTAAAL
jgi:hypothetical protein